MDKTRGRPGQAVDSDVLHIRARMGRLPSSPILRKLDASLSDLLDCSSTVRIMAETRGSTVSGPGASPVFARAERAVDRILSYLLFQIESYCAVQEARQRSDIKPVDLQQLTEDSQQIAALIWKEAAELFSLVAKDGLIGDRVRNYYFELVRFLRGTMDLVKKVQATFRPPRELPCGAIDSELAQLILQVTAAGGKNNVTATFVEYFHTGLRNLHEAALCIDQAEQLAKLHGIEMPQAFVAARETCRRSLSFYIFHWQEQVACLEGRRGRPTGRPVEIMRSEAGRLVTETGKIPAITQQIGLRFEMFADRIGAAADSAEGRRPKVTLPLWCGQD